MRKLLVWAVLLGFAFGLTSCKDDDPKPVDPIVGTWTLQKYTMTELPPNFTRWEGAVTDYLVGWELGYTIVFNADGTYSRAYLIDEDVAAQILPGATSIYDKGTWTREDTGLKLQPTKSTDLTLIEAYGGTPGTDFTINGNVDTKLTVSGPVTMFLLSDAFTGDTQPTADDYHQISVKVLFDFVKLN